MKKTLKIASFLLAILLLALPIVACSDTTQDETTQATASTTTAETVEEGPEFPEADYKGEKFTVYFRDQTASHYRGMYIIPLEDSADIIDETAEKRNLMVEEKYNIEFVGIEATNPSTTLQNDVATGSCEYEVVLEQRSQLGPLALKGALTNLNNLDIDYTTTWWDANAAYSYEIGGKLYVMPNDVSVSNISACRFFYFNKDILEKFQLTSPYEYVANNTWTLDNFISMVKSVSAPNTDGTVGVYGLANEANSVRSFMLSGCGVQIIERTEDGGMECTFGTKYLERAQSFFDQFNSFINDSNCVLTFDQAHEMDQAGQSNYIDKYTHARGLFASGHFLFTQSSMACANEFAEMETAPGVVMNPKFNSDQENYYHKVDNNNVIWAVPKDASLDLDYIATIMDYWAYASSKTVMESYYEVTLKVKRASDPTTATMLDTIKASIVYSPTDIYSVSTSDMISAAATGSTTSAWNANKKIIDKLISNVVSKIAQLED